MRARARSNDWRVLWQLLRGLHGSDDHAARLERFYGPQADAYDAFRARLLHGRRELVERLAPTPGSHLVELGAGTGHNVALLGHRRRLVRISLVDLCPSLAAVARARVDDLAGASVHVADATRWQPDAAADCVLLSYALTMMPDWGAVLDNAWSMLRDGGSIAVVDFFVSSAQPAPGRARHGWLTRHGWTRWFAHDGVHLNPAHLERLHTRFEARYFSERLAPLPYLPGLRVPYYLFIGRKTLPR